MTQILRSRSDIQDTNRSSNRSNLHELMAILLLCASIIFIWLYVNGGIDRIPGDSGDGRFNLFILEHVSHNFFNFQNLWSPNFFYPLTGAAGFSDLHLGSVIFYAIPRAIGFNSFNSMQIWILFGTILNGCSCYWVARKWHFSTLPAVVAGLIFSSALPMTQLAGHAQLVHRWAIPAAFYFFVEYLAKRQLVDQSLLYAICFCGLQFLCSPNLGVVLFLSLICLLVLRNKFSSLTIPSNQQKNFVNWSQIALATAISIYTCVIALKYSSIKHQYRLTRSASEILTFTPSFGNLLVSDNSRLWDTISQAFGSESGRGEAMMFPGIIVGLLLIVAYLCRSQMPQFLRALFFGGAVLLFLIIVRIGNTSVLIELSFLPGLDSLRTPGRSILVMLFPLSMVSAWVASHLSSAAFKKLKLLPAVIILISLVFDFSITRMGTSSESDWMESVYALEQQVNPDSEKPFLVLDSPNRNSYLLDLDAMLAAQRLNRTTLNGYSGFIPFGWEEVSNCDQVQQLLGQLSEKYNKNVSIDRIETVPANCG